MTPTLARMLVRIAVTESRRDDVAGDLEELHRNRTARLGGFLAWWVTSFDAGLVAFEFLVHRWKEREKMLGNWITWPEVRLGLRLIKKQPLLNLAALIALATGIGMSNVGFTGVDTFLFSELPYEAGERFLRLEFYDRESGRRVTQLDPARYHLLAEKAGSLDYLGGKDHEQLNLFYASGEVERVTGVEISPDAFRFLPARPLAGRLLLEADGEPGAPPSVMIRESIWQARFGRSPDIIGSTLDVAGKDRIVVGILPNDFRFPNSPLVWVPLDNRSLGGTTRAVPAGVEIFGIRSPDSTLESVREQVEILSRQFEASSPGALKLDLRVVRYTQESNEEEMLPVMGAMIVVLILVLLVIASNVGNLMMVRTASRSAEIAVRSALGGDRKRLVAQLFGEVAILVSLAALLGFVASNVALLWLAESFEEMPFWIEFSPSPRTVLAASFVAFLAAGAAGLAPALKATRQDVGEALKSGARSLSGLRLGRLGSTMIVLEMTISVAMVGAALVLTRAAFNYISPDLDLPSGEILTAEVRMERPRPAEPVGDLAQWQAQSLAGTRTAALEAMRGIPGVASVGATSSLPGNKTSPFMTLVESEPGEIATSANLANVVGVLPGFMETLGAEPILGRFIEEADLLAGAPQVAVVNERFVRRFLGGRNPLGRRIRMVAERDHADSRPEWIEIVGVVQDLGMSVADPGMAAGYYLPLGSSRGFEVAIRVQGNPMSFAGPLMKAVGTVDPTITVRKTVLLEDAASEHALSLSLFGGALILLGSAALVLSLVGVFVITSLTVTQRTREIGIRAALGASSRSILTLVARRAMAHLLIGAGLGAGLGALVLQATNSVDAGIPAGAPWELPGVALVLGLAGVAACLLPGRRALRVNPSEALAAD